MTNLLTFLANALGLEPSSLSSIANILLSLKLVDTIRRSDSVKNISESLAANVVWSAAIKAVGHFTQDDLATLVEKSLQDAIKDSRRFYDDIGKERAGQIAKAMSSDEAKRVIRNYKTPPALAQLKTEDVMERMSEEISDAISSKVNLPPEDVKTWVRQSFEKFQEELWQKVDANQKLRNLVNRQLGVEIFLGTMQIRDRVVSPYDNFAIILKADVAEIEKELRCNPTKINEHITRLETSVDPSGKTLLILGRPGSGKTTEVRNLLQRVPENRIAIIRDTFTSDDTTHLVNQIVKAGSVALVWDDFHKFPDRNRLASVVNTVRRVAPNGTMVLAARSTDFEPFRREIDQSFWQQFDEIVLDDFKQESLKQMIEICSKQLNVALGNDLESALLERIKEAEPTPFYVVSVFMMFKQIIADGEPVTIGDIHEIPQKALEIWSDLFQGLKYDPNAQHFMRAMKLIDEASIPSINAAIAEVYEHVFAGNRTEFQAAMDKLDSKGWIRKVEGFCISHDLQLEATEFTVNWYDNLRSLPEKFTAKDGVTAMLLHNFGVVVQQRGDYEVARRMYNQSLEISRRLGEQLGIATSLHQLGIIEQDHGNYDEARRLYNESLEIDRRLGDQSGIARTLHNLANIEYLRGKYDEAKRLYKEVLVTFRKMGDQSGIALTLNQLGLIEQRRGNYDEASKLYNQSLEINRRLGAQSGIASTLHNLGMIEEQQGSYDEAKRLYNESLEIERRLGDPRGNVRTLNQLGNIEYNQGSYDEAKRLYNESLEIERRLGDPRGNARTLHNLANIEYSRRNYDEAERLCQEVLVTFKKLGDQLGIATSLRQLGMIEQRRGNYDEAKRLYKEVLVTFRKMGDQSGIARALHNLANIEYLRENHDEAKRLYDQSLDIKRRLGDQLAIAVTLNQLGLIEHDRGNHDEARRLYNESLEIERRLGDQSGIARTLGALGSLYEARGDLETAEENLSEALEIFTRIGDKPMQEQASQRLERIREKLRQKK